MIYVGIIGPKPFLLDGHDASNFVRVALREKFRQALDLILAEHQCVKGLTGLSIGAEQDFAVACRESGIEYEVILPFDSQELMCADVQPTAVYEQLLKDASGQINLGDVYSPKGVLNKHKQIIRRSDYVFIVPNKLIDYKELFKEYLADKRVIEFVI